ncbi:unnamed protein product [Arabidopsis thaliana]|nr:unnamed protein product [Arabidopsis thaliana]
MDVDGALGLLRFGYLAIGSHIPLPCGAASLLLPFGTGHEIYIPLIEKAVMNENVMHHSDISADNHL